jgi:hypothetical protein
MKIILKKFEILVRKSTHVVNRSSDVKVIDVTRVLAPVDCDDVVVASRQVGFDDRLCADNFQTAPPSVDVENSRFIDVEILCAFEACKVRVQSRDFCVGVRRTEEDKINSAVDLVERVIYNLKFSMKALIERVPTVKPKDPSKRTKKIKTFKLSMTLFHFFSTVRLR